MKPSELVDAAMKAQGIDPDDKAAASKLADALGYRDFDPAKIGRWRKDDHGPKYDATIRLLEAAGLLRAKASPAQLPRRDEDVVTLVAEGFDALHQRLDALEGRRSTGVRPA
ncbi:MAG: hypothetical protein M3540_10970 [Actinomycetota bacterium]|nr:hypothetical protein [Actinomycetota bacterium]